MALILAKLKSATAVKLSAALGIDHKQFRQFIVWADDDNTGNIYIGKSNVTGVPANELMKLKPTKSVNFGPVSCERPFVVDTDRWYAVGSDANQVLWIQALVEDQRNK